MASYLQSIGPVLTIDIGNVFTRAIFYDVVDERYRLIGAGRAFSTLGRRGTNIRHGVRMAIEEIQASTGRVLLNPHKNLYHPLTTEGYGVNQCVVTVSAGPPLSVFLLGLAADISLVSAGRLAQSISADEIKSFVLNEKWKTVGVLDEILRDRPDLIIICGGSNGGASDPVWELIEPVRLAFLQIPAEYRPEILFVGNQNLQPEVLAAFNQSPRLHVAPNLRPEAEFESMDAALAAIARIAMIIKSRQLPGLVDLIQWTQGNTLTSAAGLGRVVRYLSHAHGAKQSVLAVDLGMAAPTLAAVFNGQFLSMVGRGHDFAGSPTLNPDGLFLQTARKWLVEADLTEDAFLEFLLNKELYPASLPQSKQELAMHEALVRSNLQLTLRRLLKDALPSAGLIENGLPFGVEPILATGGVLTSAANPGWMCLLLLDSLQPAGITTLVVDTYQTTAGLGALAAINPALAVQVLDSNTFTHLATVVSPIGHAPPGTPILRVRMQIEERSETVMDVRQGDLELIPLPPGKTAQIQLQPFQRCDIGMGGPGRGGNLRVVGSALGIVIDGRGRPIQLPEDPGRRKELFRKWRWTLGI